MPEAVITTAGARRLLAQMRFGEWVVGSAFYWSCYTNNFTPDADSVLAQFDRSGMTPSPFEVDTVNWQEPTLIGDRWRTFYAAAATEFTAIPLTVTVYGFLFWAGADSVVQWAQRLDTPVPLLAGQKIKIWPYFDYGPCP